MTNRLRATGPAARVRVGIIGAGPAGMTAAYQLQQLGADVTVFEASDKIGGLARSFDLWGQRVDLGPHRFFSADPRVNRLWHEVLEHEYRVVARQTRIYYRERFFDYPLKVRNVIANLRFPELAQVIASYVRERLRPERTADERDTFEAWVVHHFGRRLYQILQRETLGHSLRSTGCRLRRAAHPTVLSGRVGPGRLGSWSQATQDARG